MEYYFDIVKEKEKKAACKNKFEPLSVFSDETENFRNPAEPTATDFVEIFLQVGRDSVSCAYLCIEHRKKLMQKVESSGYFDRYRVLVAPTKNEQQYYFQLIHNQDCYYYTRYGVMKSEPHEGWFRIVRDFHTPNWAKGAVLYQIYVDRFCNGDKSNDVKTGEYRYLGGLVTGETDWQKQPDNEDFRHFYGGDLQGILDKLDYLSDLGVEALYLNPIFVSPSSHKYDTQDYDHIDPHYGKIVVDQKKTLKPEESNTHAFSYITRTTDLRNLRESDALFEKLVMRAHKKGIRVIIDGVFNHCGAFHKWLDKEKIYMQQIKGAAQFAHSPYREYFYWKEDGTYEGWWGYENHPKLNMEHSSALHWEMMRIAKKWVSEPYCVDGWRLDVAADLGNTAEFNHQFWRDFRNAVKSANPEAIILAEHYGDANRWLEGDQWDSIMNYDAFMEPVSWFFTGVSKHSTEYRADLHNNADAFWGAMRFQSGKIPAQALAVAMNELSNHDHSRFLTRTNGKTGRLHTEGALAADLGVSRAVMREAVLLQMTWAGAPTIYYGDEAGLTGWTDPDNRRPYPWGREDEQMIAYHKALIQIRKQYTVLRHGSTKALLIQQGILAYGRFDANDHCVVVCNNLKQTMTVQLPVWSVGVSRYATLETLICTEQFDYFTEPIQYRVKNGMVELELKPQSGMLLKEVAYDKHII